MVDGNSHDSSNKEEQGDLTQWVTFIIDAEKYGISVESIREVIKPTEIAPVPGAPDYVLGITNLRGNVVSILDARSKFGLAPISFTDETKVLIVDTEAQAVGIAVDKIASVIYIPKRAIESAPDVGTDKSSQYIQGVAHQDDELIILIELDKILRDDAWEASKSM